MHPDVHGNRTRSLAQATARPGRSTRSHRHRQAEERYYFIRGHGHLQIDDEDRRVAAGNTGLIPPGRGDLVLLCGGRPARAYTDTELQTPDPGGGR